MAEVRLLLGPPLAHRRAVRRHTSSGVQGHCCCLQYAMMLLDDKADARAAVEALRSKWEVGRLRGLLIWV